MTTTRRRPRAPGARPEAEPSRDTITIAMQVPERDWHNFQIALALDGVKMQDWVNNEVRALLAKDWDALKPQPYQRVPRGKGRTRQVIARVRADRIRALQLYLAKLAIPMSWWLYTRIQAYTKNLDQKVEAAKAKGLLNPQI